MKPPELLMADIEMFGMTISVGWNVARDWPFAYALLFPIALAVVKHKRLSTTEKWRISPG